MKQAVVKYGAASVLAAASALFIIDHEGEVKNKQGEHVAYIDAVGVHTVCFGQTGKDLYGQDIKKGMIYTEEECIKMLTVSVEKFSSQVNSLVKVEWQSIPQQVAITSFAYNVGIGAFKNSTLLRMLNQGQYVAACNQLPKWVYGTVKGKKTVLNGLVTRRNIEKDWCLGNVPSNIEYRIDEFIKSPPKDSLNYVEGVDISSEK